MKDDLRALMQQLLDARDPLVDVDLLPLSNLMREEAEQVARDWPAVPVARRRAVIEQASALADEDVQLDFSALFHHALHDDDAGVRRAAVEGLWEDESLPLSRQLMAMLADDPSDDVRTTVAEALGRFVYLGEYELIPQERAEAISDVLLKLATDSDEPLALRRRALESVAWHPTDEVVELISRSYEDADDLMRISALFAMGRNANELWSGTVRSELHNPDPRFRFEAVRAAGELGDRKAAATIIELMADADAETRSMAIWALGQIGGSTAKKALKAIAKGSSGPWRNQAREALTELALLDEEDGSLPMLSAWEDDGDAYDEEERLGLEGEFATFTLVDSDELEDELDPYDDDGFDEAYDLEGERDDDEFDEEGDEW